MDDAEAATTEFTSSVPTATRAEGDEESPPAAAVTSPATIQVDHVEIDAGGASEIGLDSSRVEEAGSPSRGQAEHMPFEEVHAEQQNKTCMCRGMLIAK